MMKGKMEVHRAKLCPCKVHSIFFSNLYGIHGMDGIAAQRILTLATESLDMLRGVTGVVKDSLDQAETWVGRLHAVGLQSRSSEDNESNWGKAEEAGYGTPTSFVSANLLLSMPSSNTSDSSLPNSPGAPVDADASPGAGNGGGVWGTGIGELSLSGLGKRGDGSDDDQMGIGKTDTMDIDDG